MAKCWQARKEKRFAGISVLPAEEIEKHVAHGVADCPFINIRSAVFKWH